jgi:hypothetical protein
MSKNAKQEWQRIVRRNTLRGQVLAELQSEGCPEAITFSEMIESLKDIATEREVRDAVQHHVQTGVLRLDLDFKISLAPIEPSAPCADEAELRSHCVEPTDLDTHPWMALMDALYQKFGASAVAYDFVKFCKQHQAWFEIAASIQASTTD